MNRAVFLDRDGTLCEEVGYLNHIDRFQIYPWTASALRRLNEAGLRTIVITNQSGVARGYFPESLVHQVHERLKTELSLHGAHLDGIYYCPHLPEAKLEPYRMACDCRKPGLGMIQRAAREHDIDLAGSFLVGDRDIDIETAYRGGMRAILVLSGYGKGEYLYRRESWPCSPDYVATDLAEAAAWILSQT
jgi:D-glycero-D-manno-heptose 1,7-bisphosphate phosphatase